MKPKDLNRRNFLGAVAAAPAVLKATQRTEQRPNILFVITDDQSWLHAGAYGDRVVKTPAFDRVARGGILFSHAYCASPSCTPSRGAILTGQHIWRLEEGGVLWSHLPNKFPVYPSLLENAGYHVGMTAKGWSPGDVRAGGWERNPAGTVYGEHKFPPETLWIDDIAINLPKFNYAGNFKDFYEAKPAGKPFCFWAGPTEPHRPYKEGIGNRLIDRLGDVVVPPFLPDCETVRRDILDYYHEIEWQDAMVAQILRLLEERGELENTLVVMTSDDGMAFPRAKATLYDYGTHIPLAICWGNRLKKGRVVDDLVSLTDLAPTFLQAAGLTPPGPMTGRSLLDILYSSKSGYVDANRKDVFTAIERHAWCRKGGTGYPSRAIRTRDFLYIRNYEPNRWPAGDPDFQGYPQGIYGDIDIGPTKKYMIKNRDSAEVHRLFEAACGKRPAEELFDVNKDPGQLKNLAGLPGMAEVKARLARRMDEYLKQTGDPRSEGRTPWESYPYYAQKERVGA